MFLRKRLGPPAASDLLQHILAGAHADLLGLIQRGLPLDIGVGILEVVVVAVPAGLCKVLAQLAVRQRLCIQAGIGAGLIQRHRIKGCKDADIRQDGSIVLAVAVVIRDALSEMERAGYVERVRAMLLTGVLEPLLKKIPPAAGLAVSAVLFALTYHLDERWLGFGGLRLALPDAWYANYFTAFFGFLPFDFYSTDYFALLPWLFLFWAGYFLHGVVGRARMEPLRRSVCPALGWMGRHSLLLYLLHQPVIYGVLSAAAVLFA